MPIFVVSKILVEMTPILLLSNCDFLKYLVIKGVNISLIDKEGNTMLMSCEDLPEGNYFSVQL